MRCSLRRTARDGYRIVCQKQPDLVILDLMLPVMSGYDICTEMRKHGMATPILMLTAQDQESYRIRGFEVGADDYVTKPFSVQEIIGRVRAILRRSAGRSDLATQRELERAHEIQQRLMPVEIPQISGLCIAGTCRPRASSAVITSTLCDWTMELWRSVSPMSAAKDFLRQ